MAAPIPAVTFGMTNATTHLLLHPTGQPMTPRQARILALHLLEMADEGDAANSIDPSCCGSPLVPDFPPGGGPEPASAAGIADNWDDPLPPLEGCAP